MVKLIANWFLNALALLIVSRIIPGIFIEGFVAALIAIVVISLVNILVKPVLVLFTLPATIVTLGLFLFVINALLLLFVGNITPGFRVDGFMTALIGSILFSIISTILQSLVK